MISRFVLVLPLFFASVSEAAECTPRTTDQSELQANADWIIEGSVTLITTGMGANNRPSVVIGDAKIIQAKDVPPKGKTFSFEIDQCFLGDMLALQSKAGTAALVGKSIRFYGRLYDESPRRRFFYYEPVAKPFQRISLPIKTQIHQVQAENAIDGGWNRARSTEGKFSVDLPGPFNDATVHEDGEPIFMLGATDESGAKFIALFERSGPREQVGKKFERDLSGSGSAPIQFNGYPALRGRTVLPGSGGQWVATSLRIKAQGGVYVLTVTSPIDAEPALRGKQERFFNSLAMP